MTGAAGATRLTRLALPDLPVLLAVLSVWGSGASLLTAGGTHAMKEEFQGINEFEVVAFFVVLPESNSRRR